MAIVRSTRLSRKIGRSQRIRRPVVIIGINLTYAFIDNEKQIFPFDLRVFNDHPQSLKIGLDAGLTLGESV